MDLEITGVCYAIKKLDFWLRCVKFVLVTDSSTFMTQKRIDETKPAIVKKIIFLQQYDFDIIHKDGIIIPHVDTLSRQINDTVN